MKWFTGVHGCDSCLAGWVGGSKSKKFLMYFFPKDQQQKLESRVQVPPLRPNVQNRGGKITIVFINHWFICSQSFGLVGWAVGEITLVVDWKMLSIVSDDIRSQCGTAVAQPTRHWHRCRIEVYSQCSQYFTLPVQPPNPPLFSWQRREGLAGWR